MSMTLEDIHNLLKENAGLIASCKPKVIKNGERVVLSANVYDAIAKRANLLIDVVGYAEALVKANAALNLRVRELESEAESI
jgi:hypothetical protein